MIEIPEARVLSAQINKSLTGKTITKVVAAQTPHKFAWYSGDPASYKAMLIEKTMGNAEPHGGMVEIKVGDVCLLFGDGVNLRFYEPAAELPAKHQLLLTLADGSSLCASVAMYGGMWCFAAGTFDNPYYLAAKEKPSPLTSEFNESYFANLFSPEVEKYSLKAFLATGQRIPGLGNGVLQDILFNAGCHPKRKVLTLIPADRSTLHQSIRSTLKEMADQGGRDTEVDLFGNPGGYTTRLSRNTVGHSCLTCGQQILKQPYMGGSIYFCPGCQPEI